VVREDLAESLLEIPAKHVALPFATDESWLLYAYHVRTMWTVCPESADKVQRPSHITKKATATVSFKGTGMDMTDILPQNQKINAEYSAPDTVTKFASVCYPNGRRLRERECSFHFDKALIHNPKVATDKLEEENMKRMPPPTYGPDRPPCDFFLSGHLKDKLIDKRCATPEELFCEMATTI
jgi:hypothetical protein